MFIVQNKCLGFFRINKTTFIIVGWTIITIQLFLYEYTSIIYNQYKLYYRKWFEQKILAKGLPMLKSRSQLR